MNSALVYPDIIKGASANIKAMLLYWENVACISFTPKRDFNDRELNYLCERGLIRILNLYDVIPLSDIYNRKLNSKYLYDAVELIRSKAFGQLLTPVMDIEEFDSVSCFGEMRDTLVRLFLQQPLPLLRERTTEVPYTEIEKLIDARIWFMMSFASTIQELVSRLNLVPQTYMESLAFLSQPCLPSYTNNEDYNTSNSYSMISADVPFPSSERMLDVSCEELIAFRNSTNTERIRFREMIQNIIVKAASVESSNEYADIILYGTAEVRNAINEYKRALKSFFVKRLHAVLTVSAPSLMTSASIALMNISPEFSSAVTALGLGISAVKWYVDTIEERRKLRDTHPVHYLYRANSMR